MKTKRNLIQIWLLCTAMLPAVVQAQFSYTNGLDYTITIGTITITGYIGTNTVVTIPEAISGLQVTKFQQRFTCQHQGVPFGQRRLHFISCPIDKRCPVQSHDCVY